MIKSDTFILFTMVVIKNPDANYSNKKTRHVKNDILLQLTNDHCNIVLLKIYFIVMVTNRSQVQTNVEIVEVYTHWARDHLSPRTSLVPHGNMRDMSFDQHLSLLDHHCWCGISTLNEPSVIPHLTLPT